MEETLTRIAVEYSLFINIPIFAFMLSYVIILLGWFFSTDYYDKFHDFWDDPNEDIACFHAISGMIIVFTTAVIIIAGISSVPVLLINATLAVTFIIPSICLYLSKVRKNIRMKRGKL